MAKQDLLDRIISEAEEKAAAIRADAKARADSLILAAEEESAALSESARKLAASSAPETLKRRKSMAELEVRKIVLAAKQSLIAEAYSQAAQRVLASKNYPDLLVNMICAFAEEGDQVVFASSDGDRINQSKILAAAKAKLGFTVPAAREKGDFMGGIVLLGKSYDKNLTLETELGRISENSGAEKILFK